MLCFVIFGQETRNLINLTDGAFDVSVGLHLTVFPTRIAAVII